MLSRCFPVSAEWWLILNLSERFSMCQMQFVAWKCWVLMASWAGPGEKLLLQWRLFFTLSPPAVFLLTTILGAINACTPSRTQQRGRWLGWQWWNKTRIIRLCSWLCWSPWVFPISLNGHQPPWTLQLLKKYVYYLYWGWDNNRLYIYRPIWHWPRHTEIPRFQGASAISISLYRTRPFET